MKMGPKKLSTTHMACPIVCIKALYVVNCPNQTENAFKPNPPKIQYLNFPSFKNLFKFGILLPKTYPLVT